MPGGCCFKCKRLSDRHGRHRFWNDQCCLRGLLDIRNRRAWSELLQKETFLSRLDDRHFGYDQADTTCRGQRQGAVLNDLRLAFDRVRHRDDDALGPDTRSIAPPMPGTMRPG